jgi:hypothetical protein
MLPDFLLLALAATAAQVLPRPLDDTSYARGEPITFRLGQLIPGWQQALPLAGTGDILEVTIPWSLAYGPRGKGPSPATPRSCSQSSCWPSTASRPGSTDRGSPHLLKWRMR